MRLESIERASLGTGRLHRLDARVKLIGLTAFVVLIAVTPLTSWHAMAYEGLALAFLLGLSGIPLGLILRRWLAFAPLFLFLAILLARSHPLRETQGYGAVAVAVVARNSMALIALLILAGTTPFPMLLNALARLRTPSVLVATLHFMYRYLHVLSEELNRMLFARRARSFRRSGRLEWGRLGGMIGMLFLRSMERGERVHAAMLARGWDERSVPSHKP